MTKKEHKIRDKRIREISQEVERIKVLWNEADLEKNRGLEFLKNVTYIPSPIDIAAFYGIRIEFRALERDVPSYLEKDKMTIYISNKYKDNNYVVRHLCAHELGHFFLHDKKRVEMNIFSSKTIEEYEANVFSILLMPQIMGGEQWEKYEPKILNMKMYNKIFNACDG